MLKLVFSAFFRFLQGSWAKQQRSPSLLARYVICGNCGSFMVRHTATKNGVTYYRMVCPTSKKSGNDICSSHIIDEEVLVEVVLEALKKQIDTIVDIEKVLENIKKQQLDHKGINYYKEKIKTVEHKQKRVMKLKRGLYEDLKSDIISETEYNDYKKRYQEQYDALNVEINKYSDEISKIKNCGEENHDIIKKIKSYVKINSLNRELVVELIDSIYVYDNRKIDINFNFKNEIEKLQQIIAS